jgi:hypothetical protein
VFSREFEKAYVEEKESLHSTTVGMCSSANGSKLPTPVILESERESSLLATSKCCSDYLYFAHSRKGWITKNIFCKYMRQIVLPMIVNRLKIRFFLFLFISYIFLFRKESPQKIDFVTTPQNARKERPPILCKDRVEPSNLPKMRSQPPRRCSRGQTNQQKHRIVGKGKLLEKEP